MLYADRLNGLTSVTRESLTGKSVRVPLMVHSSVAAMSAYGGQSSRSTSSRKTSKVNHIGTVP